MPSRNLLKSNTFRTEKAISAWVQLVAPQEVMSAIYMVVERPSYLGGKSKRNAVVSVSSKKSTLGIYFDYNT
jgi:hypothetical protein